MGRSHLHYGRELGTCRKTQTDEFFGNVVRDEIVAPTRGGGELFLREKALELLPHRRIDLFLREKVATMNTMVADYSLFYKDGGLAFVQAFANKVEVSQMM